MADRIALGVLWGTAVVALGACGGSSSLDVQETSSDSLDAQGTSSDSPDVLKTRLDVQEHNGVTALVKTGGTAGSDAVTLGVVEVGPGGCLGLTYPGADGPLPVLWPEGTELAEDGNGVVVPVVGEIPVGWSIRGGGHEWSNFTFEPFVEVPTKCLDRGVVIDVLGVVEATPEPVEVTPLPPDVTLPPG